MRGQLPPELDPGDPNVQVKLEPALEPGLCGVLRPALCGTCAVHAMRGSGREGLGGAGVGSGMRLGAGRLVRELVSCESLPRPAQPHLRRSHCEHCRAHPETLLRLPPKCRR